MYSPDGTFANRKAPSLLTPPLSPRSGIPAPRTKAETLRPDRGAPWLSMAIPLIVARRVGWSAMLMPPIVCPVPSVTLGAVAGFAVAG